MGEAKIRRKVFISYHHKKDGWAKEALIEFNKQHDIFIDGSVDIGEIDDRLPDETIRRKIRDEYLRDTTVTILLVGTETKYRKHIDWELYSSMYDGSVNRKSGLLVINLPSTNCALSTAAHPREKEVVHPECKTWINIDTWDGYRQRYPYIPDRIIDNLVKKEAKISVVPWGDKLTKENLEFLIEAAFQGRESCEYDLSREMRRNDYNPNP